MHLMKDQQFVYYHNELTEVYMKEQHVTCSLNVNSVVACLDSLSEFATGEGKWQVGLALT